MGFLSHRILYRLGISIAGLSIAFIIYSLDLLDQ